MATMDKITFLKNTRSQINTISWPHILCTLYDIYDTRLVISMDSIK